MKQKRYTRQAKILTLRILQQNDFIFLRTEKMTGIRRQTIKVWANVYGHEVFSGKCPLEQALELIDEEMRGNNIRMINDSISLKVAILDRIRQLLEDEKKLWVLAKTLKVLSELHELEERRSYNFRHPDYLSMGGRVLDSRIVSK